MYFTPEKDLFLTTSWARYGIVFFNLEEKEKKREKYFLIEQYTRVISFPTNYMFTLEYLSGGTATKLSALVTRWGESFP